MFQVKVNIPENSPQRGDVKKCAYTTVTNYTWSQVTVRDIYWRKINSRVVIVKCPIFAKKKKASFEPLTVNPYGRQHKHPVLSL